ncbi:MAG TPA: methyltransferase [Candidatus Paceibacterota bacterium]|nr:methyltransferase [Candidatus Paceibacterota bacterium]
MTKDEQWLLDEKYGGTATSTFEADKERLATGEPLGYIIGSQPFLGLKIHLDSHPLIPRPETEWWTEQMLTEIGGALSETLGGGAAWQFWRRRAAAPKFAPPRVSATSGRASRRVLRKGASDFKVLDLCAGSGAIGCAALAKLPDARVYFGEIDPAHEATIRRNIRENGLDDSRASIGIGDLFEPFGDMTFDVIAANPPYVPAGRALPASVADHEPALALYAGDDGLAVIRRIARELPGRLAPGGIAWIECDSAHAAAACALFADQGLSTDLLPDQYGVPRIVRAEKRAGSR